MISVPNNQPAAESTPFVHFTLHTMSFTLVAFPSKDHVSPPIVISLTVFKSGSVPVTFRTILLFGFHIIPTNSHHGSLIVVSSHCLLVRLHSLGLLLWSIDIITSQNDREIPTSAGTNASPMNSFKSKVSPFSLPQKKPSPTTYFSVIRGENIA